MDVTIASISTARAPAGVGIVRMSGERAIEIGEAVFQGKESLSQTDRILNFGRIVDGEEVIDEALVVAFHSPHSYTREDMVEIQCHGGTIVLERIYSLLLAKGAEPAGPGEFTRRAFLNGRMDLTQAEAVMDIIDAQTLEGQRQATVQLSGRLAQEVEGHREKLKDMLALIVANIDFPTDEVDEANRASLLAEAVALRGDLTALRDTADKGKMIREGVKTAIVGKPNVGKSSLLNALLREDRAIVTDIPGTTRDIIEEQVALRGISLRIQDTAGIRMTDDIIEREGIDRSRASLAGADLILALFDVSRPLDGDDAAILEAVAGKNTLYLLNKQDLSPVFDGSALTEDQSRILSLSLREKVGIEALEEKIEALFDQGDIPTQQDVRLTNARHKQSLDRAITALDSAIFGLEEGEFLDVIEVDLQDSFAALGTITGSTVDEEILDHVFSKFCIGK